MFDDELNCPPFYRDVDRAVWFGRVEGMKKENQNLQVLAYITTGNFKSVNVNYKNNVTYRMSIRGKMEDSEDWNIVATQEGNIKFECNPRNYLCTWF